MPSGLEVSFHRFRQTCIRDSTHYSRPRAFVAHSQTQKKRVISKKHSEPTHQRVLVFHVPPVPHEPVRIPLPWLRKALIEYASKSGGCGFLEKRVHYNDMLRAAVRQVLRFSSRSPVRRFVPWSAQGREARVSSYDRGCSFFATTGPVYGVESDCSLQHADGSTYGFTYKLRTRSKTYNRYDAVTMFG